MSTTTTTRKSKMNLASATLSDRIRRANMRTTHAPAKAEKVSETYAGTVVYDTQGEDFDSYKIDVDYGVPGMTLMMLTVPQRWYSKADLQRMLRTLTQVIENFEVK